MGTCKSMRTAHHFFIAGMQLQPLLTYLVLAHGCTVALLQDIWGTSKDHVGARGGPFVAFVSTQKKRPSNPSFAATFATSDRKTCQ